MSVVKEEATVYFSSDASMNVTATPLDNLEFTLQDNTRIITVVTTREVLQRAFRMLGSFLAAGAD